MLQQGCGHAGVGDGGGLDHLLSSGFVDVGGGGSVLALMLTARPRFESNAANQFCAKP